MKNYVSHRKIKSLIHNARKVAGIEIIEPRSDCTLMPGYRLAEDYITCWKELLSVDHPDNIVILIAEQSHITDYEIIGQMIANSPTIGSGIKSVLRFSLLVSDIVTTSILTDNENVNVQFHFRECFSEEIKDLIFFKIITDFLVIANKVSNTPFDHKFRYSLIETYATPKKYSVYADYHKCEIRVESKRYAIEIPKEILRMETYQPSTEVIPHLLPLLEKQLNKLLSKSTENRVELYFAKTQCPVKVRIETVAGELGVSTGTLKRQLKTEGTSYTKIKECFLMKRAKFMCVELDFSASAISQSLGYNDSSAFSRAFKSWTNISFEQFARQNRK